VRACHAVFSYISPLSITALYYSRGAVESLPLIIAGACNPAPTLQHNAQELYAFLQLMCGCQTFLRAPELTVLMWAVVRSEFCRDGRFVCADVTLHAFYAL